MAYIDIKHTMWRRYYFDEKLLKNGIDRNLIDELVVHNSEVEDLLETYEEMTTEENDNQPTQELFNNKGELIWSNYPIEFIRQEKINKIIE
jgi:hypothetical protein